MSQGCSGRKGNRMLSTCKSSKQFNETGQREVCDGSLHVKDMVGSESRFRGVKGREGQKIDIISLKNRFS